MSARFPATIASAIALAGCSLLVSEDFAAEDPLPPSSDASSDATEAAASETSTSADSGSEVAVDADAGVDPSLVAFWTFDHGTSALQKDETQRYDLLVSNAASIDVTGGVRGGSIVYANAGQPRVDALSTTSYPKKGTLSFWFKYTYADTDTTTRGLFDNWDSGRAHIFVRRIGDNPPGVFQVGLQPKVTAGTYAWGATFATQKDKWTHVVLTWDSSGATAALYVSGTIVKTGSFITGETFDPSEQSFVFGGGFEGAVDEIRLYDRVLSDAEALLLP